ncbi:hypothetical protein EHW66_10540 [Erwinia psidii]|uniref:Channel forming colicins domain-containing protein n=2 Tax=Erwinia psidii TaxID=69224 RepID=A0A3N6SIN0_9GAMM|nr:colicin-like pore-forming protein [Erwinia psidii]MCX8957182.1 hypothetical protein [Erwinia psidii]MCX8961834.1 hypothetical protein [Erwinia psidii]MCX8965428.1 hypothetical protein [Erwinia psidii]RQM37446.1 hypothetical protein EB241_14390 [Erwinia psidii]
MNVTGNKGSGIHWGGGGGNGNGGGNGSGGSSGSGNNASDELRNVGDSLAKAAGIRPNELSFYFVEDGHVKGVSRTATVGVGDDISAAVVDLGPVPQSLINSKGNGSVKARIDEQYSISTVYKGDISDARIVKLQKVIVDNAKWANSTQSGRRITKARAEIRKAREEIAIIRTVRQKQTEENEKDALNKASELISDMGEKVSAHLGEKYKSLANEIANNLKNFRGKTIRSFEDAMKSLNRITSNPGMKINKADRDALVNIWKHVNASDMANKLGNLSKAFKMADVAIKIEKVREKSIEGYETGNWSPLMLEVESWVLSGIAASIALALYSAIIGVVVLGAGAPATAVAIIGIIVAATVAALIDDKFAEKLNNEIIRPAH